ncbi:MAG: hypothetical protein V4555_15330 [Acidobacteriota bacterium]
MIALSLVIACSEKPDHVVCVPSNDPSVFYTVESFDGNGPLGSGSTDVYAHLKAGNTSDRQLVLHGLYLNTRITWIDRDNVILCLAGGLTSEYHN